MVNFFSFEQFHGKKGQGSANIRVHQLIKYWDEAELYKYGNHPDVLIFQKVYWLPDYHFPVTYPDIKILDICDPDWLENQYVKRTIDAMDAVVTPTKDIADFIKQLTDKPVRVIKDRFDMEPVPPLQPEHKEIKKAVWFGYAHNADLLEFAVRSLERMNISLTVISDKDPQAKRWAEQENSFKYKYVQYNEESFYKEMIKHDVCILPRGQRAKDRFKSENKTIKAMLSSLPVAADSAQLEMLRKDNKRYEMVKSNYQTAKTEYDVKKSIEEYKELIKEIINANTKER